VAGALALLVVAAVVVAVVMFGGSPEETEPTPSAGPSGGAAVPERIAPPELVGTPVLDGTTVVITVSNPDPQEDDQFVWKLSNRPDQPQLRPVEGDVVRVEGYVEGTPSCADISVLRKGKTSDALTVCYPPA
jgi:eukaryotic-like serine/threonine-protein kinase